MSEHDYIEYDSNDKIERVVKCTCKERNCKPPCHGKYAGGCGCEACNISYGDFLDFE